MEIYQEIEDVVIRDQFIQMGHEIDALKARVDTLEKNLSKFAELVKMLATANYELANQLKEMF